MCKKPSMNNATTPLTEMMKDVSCVISLQLHCALWCTWDRNMIMLEAGYHFPHTEGQYRERCLFH